MRSSESKPFDHFSMRVASEEIVQHSSALSSSFLKFSRAFKQVSQLYSNAGLENYTKLYDDCQEVFRDHSAAVLDQAKTINNELKDLLYFHHVETKSFHELWARKEEI